MPLTCESTSTTSCWSCSRRRVKCDAVKPFCKRCSKDGIDCPGYNKPLTWMNVPSRPRRRKKAESSDDERPNKVVTASAAAPSAAPSNPNDEMMCLMFEAARYWNENVLPVNMPAHAPFKRARHVAVPHAGALGVMQHLFLVTCWTVWISRGNSDPMQNQKLIKHRSDAFSALNKMLPAATTDPTGLSLGAMILCFVADMNLAQHQAWALHLGAIRRTIYCRGGFSACMKDLAVWTPILVTFLILDVLLATLQDTPSLDTATTAIQREYAEMLPSIELQLTENSDLIPQPVLDAIIRTTVLRAELDGLAGSEMRARYTSRTLEIRHQLQVFDARTWASKVAQMGSVRPTRLDEEPSETAIAGWSALGHTFRLAALLYLIYYTPCTDYNTTKATMTSLVSRLDASVADLFSIGSADPDSAVEGQLWKFINWPLLILLRVRRMLDDDYAAEAMTTLSRLKVIATTTGIEAWVALASLPAAA